MVFASTAFVAAFVFLFVLLMFGQLTVNAESPSIQGKAIEEKALAYIKNVLPLDMRSYTITQRSYHELPEPANTPYRTEAVTYTLNSSGSLLTVHCMFRNGVQYTCDLRVQSGSVISDRPYANLTDIARNILEKHQAHIGIDSTEYIRMLDMGDSTKNQMKVTSGNITLTVSHIRMPTGLKMVNVSLHINSTKTIDVTSFYWRHIVNGSDDPFVLIDFQNGVFHSLHDERSIYKINQNAEKTEVQPMSEPFPTVQIATALGSGTVIGIGLILYFKKLKRA